MPYIHTVPGRLRVRSQALKHNPDCAVALRTMLKSIPGVRSVEIRPITGSIIVCYADQSLSGETLLSTLQDWGFTPYHGEPSPQSERPVSGAAVRSIATAVVNNTLEKALERVVEHSVRKLISGLL